MSFYSEEIIEEVRSRNDIVDVIQGYVGLRQHGGTFSACCPFHQEKTPSFHVSRSKQIYKCFGCGEGGNVISFIMRYENMTFQEALKLLADRAGIALPERELTAEERREADYKGLLLEMNKEAAIYYHYLLGQKQGEQGMQYLTGRGLTRDTVNQFALGFADIARDDLYQYLRHKGYTDQMLRDSQLVDINEAKGPHDKFWNRVMFPILDANSHVIGFGGRIMGSGDRKYLNSNDSPVFKKRHNLYGLYLAKKNAKRRGIILCEGYMDVISMHQAGFDTAVASLGTAFTPEQAQLLKRYTDRVYLAYDSDGAGVNASLKAIDLLRRYGYSARVISMKPHKDPDEFIQALGADAFEERIRQAKSGIEFVMEQTASKYRLDDPEERTRFQREIINTLVTIEDPLERDNYIDTASKTYNIDKDLLRGRVNEIGYQRLADEPEQVTPAERRQAEDKQKKDAMRAPQKLLLTYFVNQPELIGELKDILSGRDFYEPVYAEVAAAIYKQYEQTGTVMPASILNRFMDLELQKQAADIFQTSLKFEVEDSEWRKTLTELVRKVKLASIDHELEASQDVIRWQELSKEKNAIMQWRMP